MIPIFDPWSATLEEAMAAYRTDTTSPPHARPHMQWAAAQGITAARHDIESGSGVAVIDAVAKCVQCDLVAPDWLARAFLRRWRMVKDARVDSWDHDDAFGAPFPKGSQLAAIRRRRSNRIAIHNIVSSFVRMNPDEPLDPHWDDFGRQIGEGRTRAQELHAEACRMFGLSTAADLRESQGWPRVPTKFKKLAGRRKVR